MNDKKQKERRIWLIRELQREMPQYQDIRIPVTEEEQWNLLRSLFNVRPPYPASQEFLKVQDEYLSELVRSRGIVDAESLPASELDPRITLWQGDITTLRCDAIVNAANSALLGCFCPNHGCIDNAIHTYAGIQLRQACADLMDLQGRPEETGLAKITPAFNLPCKYVIHTVGPIVYGPLTAREESQLASCYQSSLALAEQNHLQSIAFCCISTGEFHFPPHRAAEIAVQTVKNYREQTHSKIEVIFNVFKESDYILYRNLLGANP